MLRLGPSQCPFVRAEVGIVQVGDRHAKVIAGWEQDVETGGVIPHHQADHVLRGLGLVEPHDHRVATGQANSHGRGAVQTTRCHGGREVRHHSTDGVSDLFLWTETPDAPGKRMIDSTFPQHAGADHDNHREPGLDVLEEVCG